MCQLHTKLPIQSIHCLCVRPQKASGVLNWSCANLIYSQRIPLIYSQRIFHKAPFKPSVAPTWAIESNNSYLTTVDAVLEDETHDRITPCHPPALDYT